MNVQAGDVIRVADGTHGHGQRLGKVLRVEGTHGRERLYVFWEDDSESLLFPCEGIEILCHADPHSEGLPTGRPPSWGPLWD